MWCLLRYAALGDSVQLVLVGPEDALKGEIKAQSLNSHSKALRGHNKVLERFEKVLRTLKSLFKPAVFHKAAQNL